ncbi:RICIN domain-containing protein [Streptomyces deccanensis]|uniref:RICIN domain-containing protein n=1 Tax=Streptomyces deccanensis TaxID=424188 RepID=UPI001EFBC8D6|nr:RICIN domain-containing protein [Streptomyces deccanensis]ULR48551.1 RICIN domain-containing protein [Streptomyces deccanensis]
MPAGPGDFLFGIFLAGVGCLTRINKYRAEKGLIPVFIDKDLSAAAARHTSDMANHPWVYKTPGRDAHKGSDDSTPGVRIVEAAGAGGWVPENNRTGEILYWGGAYLKSDAPMNWWLQSPGHEALIREPDFTHMGFSASHNGTADEWVYGVTFARSPVRPLHSKFSDKVLDVEGISNVDGAKVQIWDYWGGGNQRWRMEPVGDGYVRLIAQHVDKVMDVEGISTAQGARLHQWKWWGGDNQRFLPEVYGGTHIKLTAKHSGKVLEVESDVLGAPVYQGGWVDGHSRQLWRF